MQFLQQLSTAKINLFLESTQKWEYMYLSYNNVLILKISLNPFTPKSDFIDFTLANA